MSKKDFHLVSRLLGVGDVGGGVVRVALCASLAVACFSESSPANTGGGETKPNDGPGPGGPSSGDAGGGSATSGDGGAGGGASYDLVDDMEGATGSILAKGGRVGAWYVYTDGTAGATMTPGIPFVPSTLAPPRGTSQYAARMMGAGFTTWGAGMGFNFNDPGDGDGGSVKGPYDGSSYQGIAFWAKVGAGSTASVRVNVSSKETDPAGGACAPVAKCSDHFGKSINLTADWVEYVIKFSDLTQLGWGQSVPKFSPTALYAVQFQVAKGTTFDVWVDDVAFVLK